MMDKLHLNFRNFILNENRQFLGLEIGKIKSSLETLSGQVKEIGTKNLVSMADKIVTKIRSLLGGHRESSDYKFLLDLQTVGVNLAKALDKNDNLEQVISSSAQQLGTTMKNMGVPTNDLGVASKDASKPYSSGPVNTMEPGSATIEPELPSLAGAPAEKPASALGMPPVT
jgi:hypothetical protein